MSQNECRLDRPNNVSKKKFGNEKKKWLGKAEYYLKA